MADAAACFHASELREVKLPAGTVQYADLGPRDAPPLVFVHGVLANGNLWRKAARPLAARGVARCIVPHWPLGGHERPMAAGADLSIPGVVRLIASFLEALDLRHVTLVGNDTGGALCQLVATEHPDRLGRLVLTSCDAFDNFLPLMFRYLQWGSHVPGFILASAQLLRIRAARRLPFAYGWLAKRPVADDASDSVARPLLTNGGVRRDAAKVLSDISTRYTLAAAERLGDFKKPVLIAWSTEDRFFPREHAERLARLFKDARLEWIDDAYTFAAEDNPERLVALIESFVTTRGPEAPADPADAPGARRSG